MTSPSDRQLWQVTFGHRVDDRVTFRDVRADSESSAVAEARRQIGDCGWLLLHVCKVRRTPQKTTLF